MAAGALLFTVKLPLTLPAAVGANAMFSVADCPGVKTVPEATPLALNPVPDRVTPEIVTFELPVLLSVELSVLLLPTVTLPKLKLVGFVPKT